MRLLGIRVDEEGTTMEWGLMGNELVRVRLVGGDTLVKVSELIRKDVVDMVVEESLSCLQNLEKCAEKVTIKRDGAKLRDLIREEIFVSDEECVEREDILEYAEAVGYSREDAEKVIKEMLDDGELEGEDCYKPVEDPPLDP